MNNNINVAVGGPINADYPKVYKTKFLKPGIPFSLQVTEPDTKYVIKHNFELDSDITIPEGCLLEFDGGSLKDGTIVGQNTLLSGNVKLLNLTNALTGTFANKQFEADWFGFAKDGSDEDNIWSVFINSGLNTGVPLFLNKGDYYVYSMITIDAINGFSIYGEYNELTTIHSKIQGDYAVFYITGAYNNKRTKIKNINLVKDIEQHIVGRGIKLGNEVIDEYFTKQITCAYVDIENVKISYFRIGLDASRTWNNVIRNIYCKNNYYGVFSGCTECYINDSFLNQNVVGVYQPRVSNNEGNLAIVNGNIEQNAVGIRVDSGYAAIYNCYIENNKPNETNYGINTEYNTLYPNGCECMAGKNNEQVKVLSFVNCYFGRIADKSGLFDFDDIANLNVVGTNLENVVSTEKTHFCSVFSPNVYHFNSRYLNRLKEKTSPSYPLTDEPFFFSDDFSKWNLNGNIIKKDGIIFEKDNKGTWEVDEDNSLIYHITDEDSRFKTLILINKAILNNQNSPVTCRLRYKVGKRVGLLIFNNLPSNISVTTNNNFNYDEIHEIDLKCKVEGNELYCSIAQDDYRSADASEYYYKIISVALFEGNALPSRRITKWNNARTEKDTIIANKALVIPTGAPAANVFPSSFTGCAVYWDEENSRLVIQKPDGTTRNIYKSDFFIKGSHGETLPTLLPADIGYVFFDETTNEPIWFNGTDFVRSDGTKYAYTRWGGNWSTYPKNMPLGMGTTVFEGQRLYVAYIYDKHAGSTTMVDGVGNHLSLARFGNTNSRPKGRRTIDAEGNQKYIDHLFSFNKGYCYFDTDLKKPIYAKAIDNTNGSAGDVVWVESDGAKAGVARCGTFANRPASTDIYDGFQYHNTDTHKTMTWDGSKWYYADGTEAVA